MKSREAGFSQEIDQSPCGPSQFQEACHFSVSSPQKPLFYFYLKTASPASHEAQSKDKYQNSTLDKKWWLLSIQKEKERKSMLFAHSTSKLCTL